MSALALAKVLDDSQDAAHLAQLCARGDDGATELNALPAHDYLNATVVPVLLQGLEALQKGREDSNPDARPQDPLDFLAAYLLANNPQGIKTQQEPTSEEVPAEKEE